MEFIFGYPIWEFKKSDKFNKKKNHDHILLHWKQKKKIIKKSKLNKNYVPTSDCAHPLEHINIFCKKSFIEKLKDTNLENIEFIIDSALSESKISIKQIDGVAATAGPGLVVCLYHSIIDL